MNRTQMTPKCQRFSHAVIVPMLLVTAIVLLAACALGPTAPTPPATPIMLTPTITPVAANSADGNEAAPAEPAIILTPLTEVQPPSTGVTVVAHSAVTAPVTTTDATMVTVPMTATTPATVTIPTTVTAVVSDNQPIEALVIGVNAQLDPFETIDGSGNLVGFDIDLMNAIAQAASIEVSFVTMDFDQLLPAVANGDVDVAISAITRTKEREEVVTFSEPYFTSDQSPVSFFGGGQGLAVRSETTDIQSAADLTADVTVGVKSGTTGDAFVVENTAAQIVRYDEAPDALAALANGDVAAVVTDISVIAEFVMDNPTLDVQLMGSPLTVEEYAMAVNKDRLDLLQLLNAALSKLHDDGSYDLIFEKWFKLP